VVVAYHVGLPGFAGGFVGVDVFFVVSGFLISALLLRELELTGGIDWAGFYARRARRLLPALAVVLCATLALGSLLLLPWLEQPALARSAAATALFVANVLYLRELADYFAVPGTSPLLHTWSLSVEEQFYFAWPLLVFAIHRLARGRSRLVGAGFGVVGLASFAAAAAMPAPEAFFLAHARGWEFAVGAGLAVAARSRPPAPGGVRALFGACGLALLALTTALLGEGDHFPVPAALLPVGATAALLVAGTGDRAPAATRLLTAWPLPLLGRWSYSWYLWHWPLLALARAAALEERHLARDAALALLALALAAATVRWVEDPVRFGRPGPLATSRGSLLIAGAATLVVVAAALALDTRAAAASARVALRLGLEPQVAAAGPGAGAAIVFVWGDSHALSLTAGARAVAGPLGLGIETRSRDNCPPVGGSDPGCNDFNAAAFAALGERPQVAGVLFVARWSRHGGFPGRGIGTSTPGTREMATRLERGLFATLGRIEAAGRRAVLVAPVPELAAAGVPCLLRRSPAECSRPRARVDADRQAAIALLDRVAARFPRSVRVYDGIDGLCSPLLCPADENGAALFVDSHHTSRRGAERYMGAAAPAVRWLVDRQ
jgi:peptidoglycan/LPS O-acetylase OafA/YrhL